MTVLKGMPLNTFVSLFDTLLPCYLEGWFLFLSSMVGFLFVLSFYDGQKCFLWIHAWKNDTNGRIWNPVCATVNWWKIQREQNAWNHPVVFIGMLLLV